MDERERAFHLIKEWFARSDERLITERGSRVFDTGFGIFGVTMLDDAFELFSKLPLQERSCIVDLGSGDGRIALLAAIFTKSIGIEGDPALHAIAMRAKEDLTPEIPSLARCELRNGDYTRSDLTGCDTFFIYADHSWDPAFERGLSNVDRMLLLSYNDIFRPTTLRKGRTIWVNQNPVVTYKPADQ